MHMEIDGRIFRSYDVRGVYPEAVNEKAFFVFGQALSQMVKGLVLVGHDARTSSPSLYHALIRGLSYSGGGRVKILPVGMITTPELYFLVNKLGASAGCVITASHNPKNENGLKVVGKKAVPIFVSELRQCVERAGGEFAASAKPAPILPAKVGEYYHDLYAAFLLKQLSLKRAMRIVADVSDGTVGLVLSAMQRLIEKKKIPLEILILNGEPNGEFPAHGPSPLAHGATDELRKRVVAQEADCGFIFDSDGDRIMCVDERGGEMPADAIAILLSRAISGTVVVDPRAGYLLRDALKEQGRKVIISRVGHAFIKQVMKQSGAKFGAEFSGHYYFKKFFGADGGLFTMMMLFSALSRLSTPVSQWLASFPPIARSGEINFKLAPGTKEHAMHLIEERYMEKALEVDKLDGLKMVFADAWFLVRPSGNEDLLRLLIEAKSEKAMKALVGDISKIIKGVA